MRHKSNLLKRLLYMAFRGYGRFQMSFPHSDAAATPRSRVKCLRRREHIVIVRKWLFLNLIWIILMFPPDHACFKLYAKAQMCSHMFQIERNIRLSVKLGPIYEWLTLWVSSIRTTNDLEHPKKGFSFRIQKICQVSEISRFQSSIIFSMIQTIFRWIEMCGKVRF